MAPKEEHYNRLGTKKKPRQLSLLDVVVLLLSVFFAGLLLLSYLAPVVNPITGWIFAILGLASPVLYVVNVVLALYWVMRWKRYIFIPIAALLLGIGNLSLFFRPEVRKQYDNSQQKAAITVVSYNVEGFLNHDSRNVATPRMDSICSLIVAQNPDIVCMQEFQTTPRMPQVVVDSLLARFGHRQIYYAIHNDQGDYGWGLAVYSRYPVVAIRSIQFEGTINCAQTVDLVIDRDTVRIINCHLQSTSLNYSDRQFMTPEEFVAADTDSKKRRVKTILGKLRSNYRIRSVQADSIGRVVEATPYPVILCGDFNDTPMSYTYRHVRGDLKDSYVEKGRGVSNTYRGFFNLFRIDYVMHSEEFTTVSYLSPDSDVSDHNPVVVGLNR